MWGLDWIDLAFDRDSWRALVNAVMKLRAPYMRPALGADSCAVLIVTKGKVRNGSTKFNFPTFGFS